LSPPAIKRRPAWRTGAGKNWRRVITVNDFIRRAEYTIRPPYCKSDSYIHKKIILNSLIAEKLFALEADTNNQLYHNQEFQHYVQGRREQAMRQEHFNKFGLSRAELDDKEVGQYFHSVGRKYQIRFVVLDEETKADKLTADLRDKNIPSPIWHRWPLSGNCPAKRTGIF
jgi:hypothetical protein